jgi:hypothetical protein
MWKLGLWPRNSISVKICFDFLVLVFCSLETLLTNLDFRASCLCYVSDACVSTEDEFADVEEDEEDRGTRISDKYFIRQLLGMTQRNSLTYKIQTH